MRQGYSKIRVRWGWLCVAVILMAVMILSMQGNVCFFAKDTGNPYRKRMVIYFLPAVALFFTVFFAKSPKLASTNSSLCRALFFTVVIVFATCAFQRITSETPRDPLYFMKWPYNLITLSITASLFMGLWLLVRDAKIAALCGYWIACIAGYGYYCVALFRGDPFHPLDIFSLGTALTVARTFEYPLTSTQLHWLAWGCLLTASSGLIRGPRSRSRGTCIAKVIVTLVAAGWMAFLLHSPFLSNVGVTMTTWTPSIPYYNRIQGTLTTQIYEITQLLSQRPNGYDPQKIAAEYPELLDVKASERSHERPNVIVVMNEALADLDALWDLGLSQDPLPYLHSMEKNVIKGNAYVSVYGGGTCNTEFSFLTGTPPVPEINIPMMTILRKQTPSIVWNLRAQGYRTIAFHPFTPGNYRRDKAYPLLGFETFLSIEDVADAHQVRGYVSDQGCYEKIWELYQNKQADERLFVFTVTMQNHCPYNTQDEITPFISLKKGEETAELQAYINSIAYTDQAFKALVERFEQEEEPTIILMFGDHQPMIWCLESFDARLGRSALEEKLSNYITPFVIWSNKPLEGKLYDAVSIHYLSALLMEAAGVNLTPYDQWLLEMVQEYPIMHLHGYADANGQFTAWDDSESWPEKVALQQMIRYNRLNDHKNRLPGLR